MHHAARKGSFIYMLRYALPEPSYGAIRKPAENVWFRARTASGRCPHFQLVMGGRQLDFALDRFRSAEDESDILPLDSATATITLSAKVPSASSQTMLIVPGIRFTHAVKGIHYPVHKGKSDSLCIVAVD